MQVSDSHGEVRAEIRSNVLLHQSAHILCLFTDHKPIDLTQHVVIYVRMHVLSMASQ